MRLSISSDYRFAMTPDGAVWTDGPCHYRHWTRYLAVFDRVNVIARVRHVPAPPARSLRADGSGVGFSPTPDYLGVRQFFLRAPLVTQAARRAVDAFDAVILNVPGQIASCLHPLFRRGRPYGAQVLGDPHDIFAPGVLPHPLRPLLRWWCAARQRKQAAGAGAALYVTRQRLQQRYPCPRSMFGVSDVDLTPDAFREPRGAPGLTARPQVLVSVGTMSQLYKGFDTLIDAMALLRDDGLAARLRLVGAGHYLNQLADRVRRLRLEAQVDFCGQLPAGPSVRAELDAADLFVLPSRSEGLPRALLEAMARGLPCLASRVGGIPELLDEEDMIPPGDPAALASAIRRTLADPARRWRMAVRNFHTAAVYRAEALESCRAEFFRRVAADAQRWNRRSAPSAECSGDAPAPVSIDVVEQPA